MQNCSSGREIPWKIIEASRKKRLYLRGELWLTGRLAVMFLNLNDGRSSFRKIMLPLRDMDSWVLNVSPPDAAVLIRSVSTSPAPQPAVILRMCAPAVSVLELSGLYKVKLRILGFSV